MEALIIGIILMFLGAACGGSFGLPSKYAPKDTPWENLWGPFFFFVTILLPFIFVPLMVESPMATFKAAGLAGIKGPIIFGFLWGLGSMTLGMSFAFIGLSLAYALNYGAQIACGSMIPMLIHNRETIPTAKGAVIITGVVICLIGVVAAGRAAILKSKSQEASGDAPAADDKNPKMAIGLVIAILSGVLCACYAIAFSYGGDVMKISGEQFGNAGWKTAFAVTGLVLWGGAVSSCLYCVFQLFKNKTWGRFTQPGIGKILFLAFIMAVLHDGAIILYGLGALKLGDLGASVGYAIFMSFAIIIGNFHGFRTGEWKGASAQSKKWIATGIAILVVGVLFLAKGNVM